MKTTTDFEAMTELDTAIANKVMQWKCRGDGHFWDGERMRLIWNSKTHKARIRMGITEDQKSDEYIFSPSTSLDACREAEEVIRENHDYRIKYIDNLHILARDTGWQGRAMVDLEVACMDARRRCIAILMAMEKE